MDIQSRVVALQRRSSRKKAEAEAEAHRRVHILRRGDPRLDQGESLARQRVLMIPFFLVLLALPSVDHLRRENTKVKELARARR